MPIFLGYCCLYGVILNRLYNLDKVYLNNLINIREPNSEMFVQIVMKLDPHKVD